MRFEKTETDKNQSQNLQTKTDRSRIITTELQNFKILEPKAKVKEDKTEEEQKKLEEIEDLNELNEMHDNLQMGVSNFTFLFSLFFLLLLYLLIN